jgi:uncharacterized protein YutE (UPF0331/DUF86 family)
MKVEDLDKQVIENRLRLIDEYLTRLRKFQDMNKTEFAKTINNNAAAWQLRSALEATFDICGHILSRIPGVSASEYKKMAVEMGKQGVLPKDFAEGPLYEMGGYRNRMTHFYNEITPEEMYNIIQNDLGDFELFMKEVSKLIKQKEDE